MSAYSFLLPQLYNKFNLGTKALSAIRIVIKLNISVININSNLINNSYFVKYDPRKYRNYNWCIDALLFMPLPN